MLINVYGLSTIAINNICAPHKQQWNECAKIKSKSSSNQMKSFITFMHERNLIYCATHTLDNKKLPFMTSSVIGQFNISFMSWSKIRFWSFAAYEKLWFPFNEINGHPMQSAHKYNIIFMPKHVMNMIV